MRKSTYVCTHLNILLSCLNTALSLDKLSPFLYNVPHAPFLLYTIAKMSSKPRRE